MEFAAGHYTNGWMWVGKWPNFCRFQKKILNSINLDWIIECYNKSSEKENFFTLNFDKLAGTDKLRLKIISGMSAEKISETWKEGLVEFQKIREKYLLY